MGFSPCDRKELDTTEYAHAHIIDLQYCVSSGVWLDFPGGSDSKASDYNAGDPGSIPGSGRSPGEGNGNPLQSSCLRILWMEEPGTLKSTGLQRVRQD